MKIRGSNWEVGGERSQACKQLPFIGAYMDDMTTIRSNHKGLREYWKRLRIFYHGQEWNITPINPGSSSRVKEN